MEEEFTFWADRSQIIALQNKSQFDKICDRRGVKVVMKEIKASSLFNNGEVILWKKGYGYDSKLFNKTKKLAKELDLDIILMPDNEIEDGFPLAFTNSEQNVFLILAPRGFDGNSEVHDFAENWNDKPDVLLQAAQDDLRKACDERNELSQKFKKLKTIMEELEKEGTK